tara:strand:+ start:251 stop:520 length:270 start_codon:yes stop_codon:yes gene_type:complete
MNRRNSKQIKKKSEELVVAWLQTMLIEEEQKKLTVENFEKYLPEQTHIYVNNKVMLSAYTPRWFKQRIKKIISTKNLKDITWSDIENLG